MATVSSRLRKDAAKLYANPPPDVVMAQSTLLDLTNIPVYLEGPASTPFEGAYYKVILKTPIDYPNQPPRVFFGTKIFHPNVEPSTGEVCVDTLKRDWSTDVDLTTILVTIRCLLIQPNPDSSLNEEAGKLIQEDYSQYERTATLMAQVHGLKKKDIESGHAKVNNEDNAGGVLQPLSLSSSQQQNQNQSPPQPLSQSPKKKKPAKSAKTGLRRL